MKLLATIVKLLVLMQTAFAGFALFQVAYIPPTPDVTCNFVTGVATGTGAGTCVSVLPTCNGVTDDTASFDAFVTWAINTWQASHAGIIRLTIGSGKNCQLNQGSTSFSGIKQLQVVGFGATLSGNYFHLGGGGQYQNNLHSTRLMAVVAGATSVAVNPSSTSQPAACNSNSTCAALFTVGSYALISGYDLQTGIGFPTNPFYFQYLKVTAINNSAGVITFDRAITDTYKTTWPNYNTGSASEADPGGPATLYALQAGWDTEIEYLGLTFTSTNQIDAMGRSISFRNVTFTASGLACLHPTLNSSFLIVNSSMPQCTMEADKIVETLSIVGTTIDQIGFQNSGIKQFTANNMTVRNLVGTPLAATITNSTVTGSITPGPTTNGRANSLYVSGSSVAAIGDQPGGSLGGILYKGSLDEGVNNIAGVSMSGGIITIPNTYIVAHTEAIGWSAPGTNMCWADNGYLCARTFQIVDVTKDVTNTYIQTSEAGGFPAWSYSGGKLFIRTHPAPQVTFTNVIGSADAISLSLAPAGVPLYSYFKRTYDNAASASTPLWTALGNISKINVTVGSAYAGATTPAIVTPAATYLSAAYAGVTYTTVVNIKVASPALRALDASGGNYPVSWGGTQAGDTLTNLTQALWSANQITNAITNLSGDPSHPFSVTVEFITNQGLVLP